MKAVFVNDKEKIKEFIDIAFENDFEIIELYDKSVKVDDIAGVTYSVHEKLKLVEDLIFYGIEVNGVKIGYFAYKDNLLISFGVNILWRKYRIFVVLFDMIKEKIGENFQCVLFSYNQRAIKWLQKMKMEVVCENVTILKI
jgi:hypothetical protein